MTNVQKYEMAMMKEHERTHIDKSGKVKKGAFPFNPDYNEDAVQKHELHLKEVRDYSKKLDKFEKENREYSDVEYKYLFNTFNKNSYLKYRKDAYGENDVKNFLEKRFARTLESYDLTEENIQYNNSTKNGKYHYQDIEINGEVIGYVQYENDTLTKACSEKYFRDFDKKYLPFTENIKVLDISEDPGYMTAQFSTLDDLIEFVAFIEKEENLPNKELISNVFKKYEEQNSKEQNINKNIGE